MKVTTYTDDDLEEEISNVIIESNNDEKLAILHVSPMGFSILYAGGLYLFQEGEVKKIGRN